ncbi:CHAD domain-containing protein [Paraburkholderia sp. DHOC27]|uniref:CHAD domain-containing protein n=1 Tax=Paraburkholderia sp. DHOC27 TaxID=2303330 RepID=UPI000E3C47CE|nr:CHAD domain-containing protein [Paraburkholderia sp. DHOC27]RFU48385.1 CHAD domain-containing protein [Paraburkholderia sp. DHOC27]
MKKAGEMQSNEESSAESQFTTYAQPLADAAIEHAESLSATSDAEVLHKLRVALRRLRSLLWAYRPLLGSTLDDAQRDSFKALADAAGKTRDWDILTELLTETLGTQQAPIHELHAARSTALKESRETLSHAGIKSVLQQSLADARDALQHGSHVRTSLKKFARKRVAAAGKSLHKRMRHASRARHPEYTSYHDVRKAGKKVRYLLEFFEPLLSKKQLRARKKLKKLQKRFGTLNDVVASEALLRQHHEIFGDEQAVATAFAALEKQRKHRVRAASKLL